MHTFERLLLVCATLAMVACGGADARKERYLEKGRAFLAEGNYDKARLEFRNALQIAPDDSGIRYLVGESSERAGNLADAMKLYEAAIEDDGKQLDARARLARLYVMAGQPERAATIVEPGLAIDPKNPALLAMRGTIKARKGDDAGARADGEESLRLAPGNENAVILLAAIYQRAGETQRAVDIVRDGLQKNPRNIDMHLILAQMLVSTNRQKEAEQQLREIIRLEPAQLQHRYRLAEMQVGLKDFAGAETTLREAIAARPDDVEAKLSLIRLLASQRSPEVAEQELRTLSDKSPKDFGLRIALADFYAGQGEIARAETLYREVIAAEDSGPHALTARDRIAARYLVDGKVKEAEVLVGEVLAKNPRDTEALQMRVNIQLARGQVDEAVADLRTLLRDQPNSLQFRRQLARAYVRNKQVALAEDTLREALREKPLMLLAELAALYEEMGRTDDAIAQYEELHAKSPQSEVAANNLAMMLVTYRDDPKSLGRAVELTKPFASSPNPALLDTYGWVLYKQGRFKEAAAALQQAVDKAPNLPMLRYHLGMAQLKSGDRDNARQNLRLAVAGSPRYAGSADAHTVLASLEK